MLVQHGVRHGNRLGVSVYHGREDWRDLDRLDKWTQGQLYEVPTRCWVLPLNHISLTQNLSEVTPLIQSF